MFFVVLSWIGIGSSTKNTNGKAVDFDLVVMMTWGMFL